MPASIRPSSGLGLSAASSAQSTALLARINEKKAELEGLRQLQSLSASLVSQMEQLEEKLGTLNDGTQAVAEVMSNWGTVLRAISLASSGLATATTKESEAPELPQTLVRIPVEQMQAAQQVVSGERGPDG